MEVLRNRLLTADQASPGQQSAALLFQGWITMRMKRSSIAITAALGLAVAGGSAFTAANTGTPVASAGWAATDTAGFDVQDVEYTFGVNGDVTAGTGDDVDQIEFTLDPALGALGATQVRVRLVKADNYYTNCAATAATTANEGQPNGVTTWRCDTTGLNTLAIDTLDIVALSQEPVTGPV
jgi:hypothetical protein